MKKVVPSDIFDSIKVTTASPVNFASTSQPSPAAPAAFNVATSAHRVNAMAAQLTVTVLDKVPLVRVIVAVVPPLGEAVVGVRVKAISLPSAKSASSFAIVVVESVSSAELLVKVMSSVRFSAITVKVWV